MSFKKYEDGCPGCLPVVLDLKTGQPLPEVHPLMAAVLEVWKEATRDEKVAFHNFTCNNSRHPADIAIMQELAKKMALAADKVQAH